MLVKYTADPFVACTRSNHWVNAPALYRRDWYLNTVARAMCASKKRMVRSGLVRLRLKPHHGHYGRKLEQFVMRALAGRVICHTEGITEHVEFEDYNGDPAG
ncbi:hypothetical protein DIPPA_01436 [Diplonema papillatum]|nr:hypothetical protein DIPPA_01436 [Diplonema papillatum]